MKLLLCLFLALLCSCVVMPLSTYRSALTQREALGYSRGVAACDSIVDEALQKQKYSIVNNIDWDLIIHQADSITSAQLKSQIEELTR